MIDWALFTLLVLLVCLIFLAFTAWRGIRAEMDRITAIRAELDGKVVRMEAVVEACKTRTDDMAHAIRDALSEARAAAVAAAEKKVDPWEAKIMSLQGSVRALQRWSQRAQQGEDEETGEEGLVEGPHGQGGAAHQLPFPPPPVTPAVQEHTQNGFGRVRRRG